MRRKQPAFDPFFTTNKIIMQHVQQLVLTKSDYEIIMANLRNGQIKSSFNQQDAKELEGELKKATLVAADEVPQDLVRLNSTVTIKDEKRKKVMDVTIVTPDKVDIGRRKISILSPIGRALIGYRKGCRIKWKVPAGLKTFTILDVNNAFV
jgi:regulator of nucleoside diphosphate kinase